ncbi:hypothetical protein ACFVZJ_21330 [Streptomyces sp. NPDC058322]|uniref:hypothetical protein n=1 Tax=Streptomyces sp. NPDC058322 TaxID=3346446 RepID=UPI0036E2B613
MTTSPPLVNGHKPAMPVLGEWQAITKAVEPPVVEPKSAETASSTPDLVAQAEAEAIRSRAWAEAEASRIAAEAEAEAVRIKAAADAEKQRLANERAAMAAEEKRATHAARMAKINAEQEETERQAAAAREAADAEREAAAASAEEIQNADDNWRFFAIAFAVACGVVALPVQMSAFWHPDRPWMISAPFMLEAGAWVVLRGAAAAVAAHRPHWHFRLIAWALAFVAAGVNLWHGLASFDPATAIGTAFASLAGPGVWDLHEHGRIRRRDGVPTRAERKAAAKAGKKKAAEQAAQEAREAAREEARQKAIDEIGKKLAEARENEFPDEWKYALRLASAMGETAVTDAVWERAWDDLHAAEPGVTATTISARNAAAIRVARVRERGPENDAAKATLSQRAPQMPPARKPGPKVRAVRRPGDTPKYVNAARKQAAITAKRAADNT